MHRSGTMALAAALTLVMACAQALAQDPDALSRARSLLAQGDATRALSILESALPRARGEARPALLDLLAESYEAAARKAESEGRRDEAAEYRENLAILRRKPSSSAKLAPSATSAGVPAKAALPAEPPPTPAVEESTPPPKEPDPRSEPPRAAQPLLALPTTPAIDPAVRGARSIDVEPPAQDAVAPLPPVAPIAAPIKQAPAAPLPSAAPALAPALADSASVPMPKPSAAGPSLEAADADFLARRYERAQAAYAALHQQRKLPSDRRDHWAYCRAVEVVRRINARPSDPSDWAAIDNEIEAIRSLSPTNWFAEYLRNRAAERNPGGKGSRSLRPNQVVVRGGSPEESPTAAPPAPVQAPARPGALTPGSLPNLQPAPGSPPADPPPGSGTTVNWSRQPIHTTNFQVTHVEANRALAEEVARVAEATREAQLKRWGDPNRGLPWSPRCEIVLFPTARDFSRETSQSPESPGFSTMGMNAGKIVLRRVMLRVDHAGMVKAVLPHEVTHVILADLFPSKQIPRWADEGMAVLAEPPGEQRERAAELNDPLLRGRLFRLDDLMKMDYPEPRYWSLYYAQSVSLTRFLVELDNPARFLAFVRTSQESGVESALKQVYQISGFDDLQARWLAFARTRVQAELTASSETKDAELAKTARE